jgi:hypothetical protein
VHQKAGEYTLVRIDENNNEGIPQTVQLVNRHHRPVHDRARVWDKITLDGIQDALIFLGQKDGDDAGALVDSLPGGFYAAVPAPHDATVSTYLVSVDAYDFTDRVIEGLQMPQPATGDVDLPLSYAGAIAGTVADLGANPIGEALVDAQQMGTGAGRGVSVTNDLGEYTVYDLDALPTLYDVSADATQSALSKQTDIDIPPPSERHGVTATRDFYLPSPGEIHGRVSDPVGSAIKGVIIAATQIDGNQAGFGAGITDEAGDYVLADLDPGQYAVQFSAVGYVDVTQQTAVSSAGSIQLDVTLPVIGTISGTVDSNSGVPIDRAEIIAEQPYPLEGCGLGMSTTTGHYKLGVTQSGQYTVTAQAEGYLASSQQVSVAQGQQIVDINFMLIPAP